MPWTYGGHLLQSISKGLQWVKEIINSEGKRKRAKERLEPVPWPSPTGVCLLISNQTHSTPYTSVSGKMAHLVTPNTVLCVRTGWLFLKCLPISHLDSPYLLRWDRSSLPRVPTTAGPRLAFSCPEPRCARNKLSILCMFFAFIPIQSRFWGRPCFSTPYDPAQVPSTDPFSLCWLSHLFLSECWTAHGRL